MEYDLRHDQIASGIAMRQAANAIIPLAADRPSIINESVALLQRWKPGSADAPAVWALDDVREYDIIPYRCCQPYTDRGDHPQPPTDLPAHWAQYHGTSPQSARPWIKPTGAQDIYKPGEYMIYLDGKLYKNKQATDWDPITLSNAWELVTDAAPGDETQEPEPTEPEQPAIATWVSLPANHPFAVGDKFADGGKVYEVKRAFTKQSNWRPPALTGDYYVIIG